MNEKKTTTELEHLNLLTRIDDEIELRRRGIKHLQAVKRRVKRRRLREVKHRRTQNN